jgi:cytochrome c oxidase assembly protein subunit 15
MRRPTLRPETYRWIALAAVLLLGFIIVTGAAVRLTDSGLGCPVGVTCPDSNLVRHGPLSSNAAIEHANRLVTGAVSIVVIVAVLGSLFRSPRRRDLVWLSWGLVGGVFAQAILGQFTVAFDLTPGFVMAHFLVSIVLLSDAIVLFHRAGIPDDAIASPSTSAVSRRVVVLGRVLLCLAGLVLFSGTFVTGTGPHSGGGAKDEVVRLDLPYTSVVRVHSGLVWLFLATAIVTVVLAHRSGAPRAVMQRFTVLLVVIVVQGGIGYVQYANDIPPLLVGFHVAGAAIVWTATLWSYLGLFERRRVVDVPVEPAPAALAAT